MAVTLLFLATGSQTLPFHYFQQMVDLHQFVTSFLNRGVISTGVGWCNLIAQFLFPGQLSVKTAPDFEKKKVYRITVKVEDEGSPPKSSLSNVNIFIEDLNDNTPTFDKNSYQFDVSEDKAVGGSVAKVIATDADSGPFGQVIYSIVSGNKGNAFGVDRNTGWWTIVVSWLFQLS